MKNWTGIALAIVLTGVLASLVGCSRNSSSDLFHKLEGTGEIDIYGPRMSMSPDGRYIFFLTDSVEGWRSGKRAVNGFSSIDLVSGSVIEHHPSEYMSSKLQAILAESSRMNGMGISFNEVGWRDNIFYLSSPSRWLQFDPTRRVFSDTDAAGWMSELECSDRVSKEKVAKRIKRYKSRGEMRNAGWTYDSGTPNNFFQYGATFAITGVDSFVYYHGSRDNNHRLYRSNGNTTEMFHTFGKGVYRPRIRQVRLSPGGRFLAVVLEKILNLSIPSPGGGYVLYLFDIHGEKEPFKWKIDNHIGSCIWNPNGTELYVATAPHGEGIYRVNLAEVWK